MSTPETAAAPPSAVSPRAGVPARVLRAERPSLALGLIVSLAAVCATTLLLYPLKHVAPVQTLGVMYLLAVVVASVFWGLGLGISTAVLSAAAFNFFHLPPVGEFTLAHGRDWVGLATFAAVAVAVGLLADLARSRARELEERRREADLASELAQLLLGADRLRDALAPAAERLALALGCEWARIQLGAGEAPAGSARLGLSAAGLEVGSLALPLEVAAADLARARERVAPSLGSILAAALHRQALQAEVVETDALRRSDEVKTALLRSVSHDLRTPVTAILTAAGALDANQPNGETVGEVREVVLDAATRLWLLIEKLLDLSLLEAGRVVQGAAWCSIEEVLHEAVAQTRAGNVDFTLSIDRDLAPLRGDPAQLERAFVNVLENAARFCDGKPVSVRARAVRTVSGARLRVRIVDQGPGIAPQERERVFLPFYRADQLEEGASAQRAHHGSGLGLAIARGFIEVNGGTIAVESTRGQGTSFVVEFPLAAAVELEPAVPVAPTS